MSELLAIFGATGDQGMSIIDYVLRDVDLSKRYSIRAITRDPSSPGSQTLQTKEAEVVKADWSDEATLHRAMEGAHTVFLTSPPLGPHAKDAEVAQGMAIADVAVEEGVEYFIYSSLPHVTRTSGGKCTKVAAFDSKAEIEEYIRTLPIKSAFFAPGSFMQNFQLIMAPRPTGSGTFTISRPVSNGICDTNASI